MNYHALNRRELQALCKEHKIPANKTNVFMADALTALLNVAEKPAPIETHVEDAHAPPSEEERPVVIETYASVEVEEEEKPVMVDTHVEDAPVAPSEESVGEVVAATDDVESDAPVEIPVVKKKARGRNTKKAAAVAPVAVPGVEDVGSAVKPAAKRAPNRSKISSLASLAVTENCDNLEPTAEEKAKPPTRVAKKPIVKSKNVRALVKAATAPDSPRSDSAASSITEEGEPLHVTAEEQEIEAPKPAQEPEVEAPKPAEEEEEQEIEAPKPAEEQEVEAPKAAAKVKKVAKKKKAAKGKGGKAKAAPTVYIDSDLVKDGEVVDTAAEEAESPRRLAIPNHFESTTPVKSPSLAHLGDEEPEQSDGEECSPNMRNVASLHRAPVAQIKYNGEEADKENSARKSSKNPDYYPKSLRKLRRQLKEAINKKKETTPASSPLKDISLNVQSPRMQQQSPSFSFQF